MALLEAHGLFKTYGGRCVVSDVSYHVDPGEIVGLLGQNGAGKTTSFRITIGMIVPDAGRVVFDGVDVTDLPMYRRAQCGMGYLSQEPSIFGRLSVLSNVLAILETMAYGRSERRRVAESLLDQFGLLRLKKQYARTLSGGERRRLEICRALATRPKMIMLDEPFSGVDPLQVEDLQKIVRGLRDRGIGILMTDHNVREILAVTDRSYIINAGRVLAHGNPRELIKDERVRRAYLGNTFRGDEYDARPEAAEPPTAAAAATTPAPSPSTVPPAELPTQEPP
jgi:lipopolysaccharide export system ATP-binding protein